MFAPISVGDGALDVPQNDTFVFNQAPNSVSSCGVTLCVTLSAQDDAENEVGANISIKRAFEFYIDKI